LSASFRPFFKPRTLAALKLPTNVPFLQATVHDVMTWSRPLAIDLRVLRAMTTTQGSAIDVFSVANRYDLNDVVTVINGVQDSVGAYPQTILLQASQFAATVRPWVDFQRTNRLGYPAEYRIGQAVHFLFGGSFDLH
jgi:hypothetical protein